ncbi:MAG: hypothetical protein QM796_14890 [Chthoniobacteraceae bacterium]
MQGRHAVGGGGVIREILVVRERFFGEMLLLVILGELGAQGEILRGKLHGAFPGGGGLGGIAGGQPGIAQREQIIGRGIACGGLFPFDRRQGWLIRLQPGECDMWHRAFRVQFCGGPKGGGGIVPMAGSLLEPAVNEGAGKSALPLLIIGKQFVGAAGIGINLPEPVQRQSLRGMCLKHLLVTLNQPGAGGRIGRQANPGGGQEGESEQTTAHCG